MFCICCLGSQSRRTRQFRLDCKLKPVWEEKIRGSIFRIKRDIIRLLTRAAELAVSEGNIFVDSSGVVSIECVVR
jgi:hypothetical protein